MAGALTTLERRLGLEGLSDPRHRGIVRLGLAMAVVAMALRMVFWLTVDRYWEDALITCLHSENFWRGLGLTHVRPGEPPLHGFTSPLSVLIPLVGDAFHAGFGVNFLKLVSIPAAGLTVLYLTALCIHDRVRFSWPLAFVVTGFAAVEHQQILYGMAGMETQVVVLAAVVSVYYLVAWRPILLGASLGVCMLARPDLAFWCMIVGAYVLLRDWRVLPRVVGMALLVYAPWIVFTTVYYGHPLPHTIFAKGAGYGHWYLADGALTFSGIKRHTWLTLAEHIHRGLAPIFMGHGAGIVKLTPFLSTDPVSAYLFVGAESRLANGLFLLTVVGCIAVAVRRRWSLLPVAGFVVVYCAYFVYSVPVIFPWYKPPILLMMLFVAMIGVQAITAWIPARPRVWLLGACALLYVSTFASVLPYTFHAEAMIQQHIENGLRKQAGLWVKERIQPDEAIGCEPLGYMGYYSQANVYDWPGLNSRTVVAWSRKAPPEERSLENMLKALRPEYLLLRDLEYLDIFGDVSWIRADYHPVKTFILPQEIKEQVPWWYASIDTRFRIYRKNHPGDAPYDDGLWPDAEP